MKYLFLALGVLALSACESFTAERYVSTSVNQALLEDLALTESFNVGVFAVLDENNISVGCRMAGPIQVAGNGDHADYIRNAFVEELRNVRRYSSSAVKTINADITKVHVSTISPAAWTIAADFQVNGRPLNSIENKHPYKTSYTAINACRNAADNFPYAVEGFIKNFLESPEFQQIAR